MSSTLFYFFHKNSLSYRFMIINRSHWNKTVVSFPKSNTELTVVNHCIFLQFIDRLVMNNWMVFLLVVWPLEFLWKQLWSSICLYIPFLFLWKTHPHRLDAETISLSNGDDSQDMRCRLAIDFHSSSERWSFVLTAESNKQTCHYDKSLSTGNNKPIQLWLCIRLNATSI